MFSPTAGAHWFPTLAVDRLSKAVRTAARSRSPHWFSEARLFDFSRTWKSQFPSATGIDWHPLGGVADADSLRRMIKIAAALLLVVYAWIASASRGRASLRASSVRRPAPAAMPRRPRPGAARSTTRRCRRRRRPPCSATSPTPRSRSTASPRASTARATDYFVETEGPDGAAARVPDRLHLRRLPAAAISGRLPGRPLPGAAARLGRAAEGAGRPALVPPLPRREDRPRRRAALDRDQSELELDVRRLPLDQSAARL